MAECNLISIHCTRPGFRRYGHQFTVPTTLVEVAATGTISNDSPALIAITPADYEDLKQWAETPNAVLSYSDPDAATREASELEGRLVEMRNIVAALERDKSAAVEAIENAQAQRAAIQAECESAAEQLAKMQADLDDRERAARALEERVQAARATFEELNASMTAAKARPERARHSRKK